MRVRVVESRSLTTASLGPPSLLHVATGRVGFTTRTVVMHTRAPGWLAGLVYMYFLNFSPKLTPTLSGLLVGGWMVVFEGDSRWPASSWICER